MDNIFFPTQYCHICATSSLMSLPHQLHEGGIRKICRLLKYEIKRLYLEKGD